MFHLVGSLHKARRLLMASRNPDLASFQFLVCQSTLEEDNDQ